MYEFNYNVDYDRWGDPYLDESRDVRKYLEWLKSKTEREEDSEQPVEAEPEVKTKPKKNNFYYLLIK